MIIRQFIAAIAIAALGAADTAAGNALGYLVSQQQTDGSWGGNAFLTALALQALPAPTAALADTDGDGIPDAVEAVIGTNAGVADGRTLISGNGNAVGGTTTANVIAPAQLNTAYNVALSAAGGQVPYEWKLVSGTLPPCISLNWNGILSGSPTEPGIYNFTYQVSDASNPPVTIQTTVAQIVVADTGAARVACPSTSINMAPILNLLLDD